MKFRIVDTYCFWWPVTVRIPDPDQAGAIVEQRFEARFQAVARERAKEITTAFAALETPQEREAHEFDLAKEFMVDWRDVEGADGKEVPFSQDSLIEALEYPWFRTGVYEAYTQAMSGEARVKN